MKIRWLSRFFSNASKLLTAFSFFRLRSDDIIFFQFVYPTIMSVAMLLAHRLLSGSYVTIKLESFVGSATTLMGVLIGFYIAALAAVTSFPNESLNSIMSGRAPTIQERVGSERVKLTRRRFLSILLGYCAFLSIFIFVLGSISVAVDIASNVPKAAREIAVGVWWMFYTWLLASLLTVTMLCLHYLIERMHRE